MKITVLGCSGGIGAGLRTTSLLVDHDVLIDAGTGVGDLSLAELAGIDHVFVTHSHLDHVASLPMMVDTVGGMRDRPLVVHALPETIADLKQHLFNWRLWPDFTEIPSRERPYLRFSPVTVDTPIPMGNRTIKPVYAQHIVPAVGYAVDSGAGTLVFTGDTMGGEPLWRTVNTMSNLRYIIIETAFPDAEEALAVMSRHLCPRLLALELTQLQQSAEIYVTHLKPSDGDKIMQEVAIRAARWNPKRLLGQQVFEL